MTEPQRMLYANAAGVQPEAAGVRLCICDVHTLVGRYVELMRTTVTLDDDIQAAVEQLRRERGLSTSAALNELARRGLAVRHEKREPFRQSTSALGQPRVPVGNIGETLEILEAPCTDDHRS